MTRPIAPAAALLGLLLGSLAGCTGEEPPRDPDRLVLEPPEDGAGHTHAPGETDAEPIGDGSTAAAGGYRMTDVRIPTSGDGPGEVSFRILGRDGEPVTDYTEEQTKLLHLYVVRDDLEVFRHLHPVQGADGTWRTRVDLTSPGDYRVLAEFVPTAAGRPVALGADAAVPGRPREFPTEESEPGAGQDGVVRATVEGTGEVSDDGRLQILISDLNGAPVQLGSYLGTSAHLTGFPLQDTDASGFVHVHPYGEPETTEDGTRLTFHTTFSEPGSYRFFVQTRVEGFLHTVPVVVEVSEG
ncbi:hypothetical protein FXB39_06740 [Nocardioides sp. BGMRC 2183]|nr:hypothetical protein FXB39_06740 [Nocardioides sp. BGMRC 2183]